MSTADLPVKRTLPGVCDLRVRGWLGSPPLVMMMGGSDQMAFLRMRVSLGWAESRADFSSAGVEIGISRAWRVVEARRRGIAKSVFMRGFPTGCDGTFRRCHRRLCCDFMEGGGVCGSRRRWGLWRKFCRCRGQFFWVDQV